MTLLSSSSQFFHGQSTGHLEKQQCESSVFFPFDITYNYGLKCKKPEKIYWKKKSRRTFSFKKDTESKSVILISLNFPWALSLKSLKIGSDSNSSMSKVKIWFCRRLQVLEQEKFKSQKPLLTGVLQKSCYKKFPKIDRKICLP